MNHTCWGNRGAPGGLRPYPGAYRDGNGLCRRDLGLGLGLGLNGVFPAADDTLDMFRAIWVAITLMIAVPYRLPRVPRIILTGASHNTDKKPRYKH